MYIYITLETTVIGPVEPETLRLAADCASASPADQRRRDICEVCLRPGCVLPFSFYAQTSDTFRYSAQALAATLSNGRFSEPRGLVLFAGVNTSGLRVSPRAKHHSFGPNNCQGLRIRLGGQRRR